MADVAESSLNITVKRKSKKKPGFEVELRDDGHYYITKVPGKCKSMGVGDRVLEINGIKHLEFKNATNANDLIDSFRLEVIPNDEESEEEESDEEEFEEVERRPRGKGGKGKAAASVPKDDIRIKGGDDPAATKVKEEEDPTATRVKEEEDQSATRVYPGEGSDDEEVDDDEEGNMEYEEEGEKRVYPGEGSDDEEVDDEEVTDDEEGNMEYEEGNMEYEEEGEMPDSEDDDSASVENVIVIAEDTWKRPTGKYFPNDRFMITVDTEGEDTGIDLVEYKTGEIYISDVRNGPFYPTGIDRGDKILSINGKKAKEITGVAHAEELMGSKDKITMFIMRSNPDTDRGHNWLVSQDE